MHRNKEKKNTITRKKARIHTLR